METINNESCLINRPGGFIITDRALSFCSFQLNSKILDLGCGSGATVNHIIQNYNLGAFGLDKNLKKNNQNLLKAAAEKIPFPDASFEGVLMECSFSVVDNQNTVLKECYRVLKADGCLIISDMYARGEAIHLNSCLGRVDKIEVIMNILENNGFTIDLFEDFSTHLQAMWGQMIFDKGAKSFYCELGVDPYAMKRIKFGYFLIVARKKKQQI